MVETLPSGPRHVVETAGALRFDVELHSGLGPVPTARAAADALGVPLDRIAKSLLFIADDATPILVVVAGPDRADVGRVADALDLATGALRLAGRDEVHERTGYEAGAVCPIGLATPIPILLDEALFDHETVFVGGGDDQSMLEVSPAELARLPDARRGAFASGGRGPRAPGPG